MEEIKCTQKCQSVSLAVVMHQDEFNLQYWFLTNTWSDEAHRHTAPEHVGWMAEVPACKRHNTQAKTSARCPQLNWVWTRRNTMLLLSYQHPPGPGRGAAPNEANPRGWNSAVLGLQCSWFGRIKLVPGSPRAEPCPHPAHTRDTAWGEGSDGGWRGEKNTVEAAWKSAPDDLGNKICLFLLLVFLSGFFFFAMRDSCS